MAKGKGNQSEKKDTSGGRNSGKALKQRPKVFDPIKRRLVSKSD